MNPGREGAPMPGWDTLSPDELDQIQVAPGSGPNGVEEMKKNMALEQFTPSADPGEMDLGPSDDLVFTP